MEKVSKMTVRLPDWEHIEAKVMASVLGYTLDGLVREGLTEIYRRNGQVYTRIAKQMRARAESVTEKR